MKDDYFYIPWDYVSKSSYVAWKYYCQYKFKRRTIDGIRYSEESNVYMDRGSILHAAFCNMFDFVDVDELLELDHNVAADTNLNPVYRYLLDKIFEVPGIPRNVDNYLYNNLKAFCRFEANEYREICNNYHTKKAIKKYWYLNKGQREKFLRDDNLRLFGTIDRISVDYKTNNIIIMDYKTGKVPIAIMEQRKTATGWQKDMPPAKTKEGNFYCGLWLLNHGFEFKPDEEGKLQFFNKGNKCTIKNMFYGYVYTGEDRFSSRNVFPEYKESYKKFSLRSFRSTINEIQNEMRTQKYFPRPEPNEIPYSCGPNCEYYEPECKDKVSKYLEDEFENDVRGKFL